MIGNGLRASVWKEFQTRFAIPQIAEFYGSTEGNANVINNMNRVGAVGYSPVLLSFLSPVLLVKIDKETNEVMRDENGLVVLCAPNEEGELVGRLSKLH